MPYLLAIYKDESKPRSAQDERTAAETGLQMIRDARDAGVLLSVARLEPAAQARTARAVGERVMFTDGPFAETKEQLGGFFLLDCSETEAHQWAARFASTPCGCSVEIRPVMWIGEPAGGPALVEAVTA